MMKKMTILSAARSLATALMFIVCTTMTNAQSIFPFAVADGYATGTTGGAGGSTVTVTTASAFKTNCESSSTLIIIVDGNLGDIGQVNCNSNKTIIGKNSSAGYRGNLAISGKTNIIVQNLNITNPNGVGTSDGIEASNLTTKVFVTKCTFTDCSDGSMDMKRGSDFITVSWCRFRYPGITGHNFPNLIGHDDANGAQDRGKLHITMHHNWYDVGCDSRMARVRFGYVHEYNIFFACPGNNYCIGTGVECHIRVENCSFENVNSAWNDMSGMANGGQIGWNNCQFVSTSVPTYAPNKWPVFTPTYSFTMDPVANVKSIVTNSSTGAGNLQPRTTTTVPVTGVTVSPTSATVNAGSTAQLTATVAPSNATNKNVTWSSSNTSVATVSSTGLVTGVVAGTATITVTTQDGSKTATSAITVMPVAPALTMQESGTGVCAFDGTIDTDNAGYTGTGFINTGNAIGQGISYKITFPVTGSYTFKFRYAANTDRPAKLLLDGTTIISNIPFTSTTTWTNWTEITAGTVTITAGTYTVRLEATGANGLGNIDNMSITGSTLPTAASCTATTTYTLTSSIAGSGTISPASGSFTSGTSVTITATAASGYTFSGWGGDLSGTTNPVTLVIDANKTITATFTAVSTYTLTTTVVGSGTVSPASGTYTSGTSITLTATPASGYAFTGWSGALSGTTNPASLTINANKAVTATFVQSSSTKYQGEDAIINTGVAETKNAGYEGTGYANTDNAIGMYVEWTVTTAAAGTYNILFHYASVGDRPADIYVNGTKVVSALAFPTTVAWTTWANTASQNVTLINGVNTIRATATTTGGCANIDYLQVSGTGTVTTYTLTTSVTGSGTISPASGTYNSGTEVSITATPASGYTFTGWGGALSGTTNPATITMDADKAVTATFTQIPTTTTVTIQESGTGFCAYDGTIDSNQAGYTGTGFVNTGNAVGQGITYTVAFSATGSYTFKFRYAANTARPCKLLINGVTVIASIPFASTTTWTNWTEITAGTVTVTAGIWLVRLEATSSTGTGNMDYMSVTGATPTVATCTTLKSEQLLGFGNTNISSNNFVLYPNPVENNINLSGNLVTSSKLKVSIYNEIGQVIDSRDLGMFEKGSFNTNMPADNIKPGVYTLKIQMDSEVKTMRFIKR